MTIADRRLPETPGCAPDHRLPETSGPAPTAGARPLASASTTTVGRVAPVASPRMQHSQWRRSGSCQMGGVWNTNRFFVRRQFG